MPFGYNQFWLTWKCPYCKAILHFKNVDFADREYIIEKIPRHITECTSKDGQQTLLGMSRYDIDTIMVGVKEQMKIGEVASKISFRTTPSVTIQYDPNVDVSEKTGQGGNTYLQVPVKTTDGNTAILPVSQRLLQKLQPYKSPCTLKITRTGDSFTTDYTVEQVKK